MAKRSKPITPASVARRVIVRDQGEVFTLPVNEGFGDPNTISSERGVDPDASEARLREQGMVLAVQRAVMPANLRAWVRSLQRRKGGNRRLAEELVAMEPDPEHEATDVRNMLRKLQEWAQGKYQRAAGRNARRVARLVIAEADYTLLGVTGFWVMDDGKVKEGQAIYRRFNTEPEHDDMARGILQSPDGSGFIDLVVTAANGIIKPYGVELVHLNGLHVEVQR